MQYFKLVNGEWVECSEYDLSHGDKFKRVSQGSILISYWGVKPPNNKIVITSHDKRAVVMQGGELAVDIEMQDGEGNILDVTDSFALPIGKVGAGNYTTLMMPFVNGKSSRSYIWNDAGEFEITSAMINMHLDESNKLDFDGFNITVAG